MEDFHSQKSNSGEKPRILVELAKGWIFIVLQVNGRLLQVPVGMEALNRRHKMDRHASAFCFFCSCPAPAFLFMLLCSCYFVHAFMFMSRSSFFVHVQLQLFCSCFYVLV